MSSVQFQFSLNFGALPFFESHHPHGSPFVHNGEGCGCMASKHQSIAGMVGMASVPRHAQENPRDNPLQAQLVSSESSLQSSASASVSVRCAVRAGTRSKPPPQPPQRLGKGCQDDKTTRCSEPSDLHLHPGQHPCTDLTRSRTARNGTRGEDSSVCMEAGGKTR
jgi:hypothetical protein